MATSAAGVLFYTIQRRRRNRSLLARTRRQAENLAGDLRGKASQISDSAADLMAQSRKVANRRTKGFLKAIEAGRAAYHRVMA